MAGLAVRAGKPAAPFPALPGCEPNMAPRLRHKSPCDETGFVSDLSRVDHRVS